MLRARVFAGLDRVRQQGKKLGRPKVSPKVEHAIRRHLRAGHGILKVAALVGVGSGVKSLATAPPISRAIATPLGLDRAPRDGVCGCWEAVGKWPAGATVESLA